MRITPPWKIIFLHRYLVEGTSLALQRGHRLSIDIDLFTGVPYGEMKTSVLDGVMWYLKFCIGYFILILLYFIYRIQTNSE